MELPRRKTVRLKGYDYCAPGYYFITVCTKDKRKLLCDIITGEPGHEVLVQDSQYGKIVRNQLEYMADFYPDIKIDKYVVMPNHIHMILRIMQIPKLENTEENRAPSKVGKFIGTFKRFCNKKCGADLWQTRSYDHVIRGDEDYQEIWNYIEGNPSRWTEDKLYL